MKQSSDPDKFQPVLFEKVVQFLRNVTRFLIVDFMQNKIFNLHWYPRKISVSFAGNLQTLNFLKNNFGNSDKFVYAEFGAYLGDTCLEIAQAFPFCELHIFDYNDRITKIQKKLERFGNRIHYHGNTYKYFDSYNYSLAMLIANEPKLKFDYCFIDGAHTFAIDGLTFYLCDEILQIGGYLDFDDYDWTINHSSLRHSSVMKRLYTPDQLRIAQIGFLIDHFVKTKSSYLEIVNNRIFRKIS